MAEDTTRLYLDVPDALAERLFVLARSRGVPLNDQAIALLSKGTRDQQKGDTPNG